MIIACYSDDMQYKLLLLDVDGTLTASKANALPSAAVIAAVQAAQQKVTVALATGRPKDFAMPVVEALKLKGYGIFNNGAEVIHTTDGSLAFEQLLSVAQLRELITLALPFGYPTYTDEDQYSQAVQSPADAVKPTAKLFIEAVRTADIPAMIETLNSVHDVIAHPTTSWKDGDVLDVHVNHGLATKRHGAEQLIDLLGITKDEVMAIGDSFNDMPLLEAASLKVAMGNAAPEVKAVADYIAPSLEDDGVADAINRFILT